MTRILTLTLFVCMAMFVAAHARTVNAEDDCAMGTLAVQRVPFVAGLVCFGEPRP